MMQTFDTKRPGMRWRIVAAGFMALYLSCVSAQPAPADSASSPASVAERYPAGAIKSVESADAALAAAARERAEIEALFAVEEQACHPRFFATPCVDQAKERRRQALSDLRRVELEANAFKRRERLTEREKAAAERQAKEETNRQERVREQRESKGADLVPHEPSETAATQPSTSPDREAEHDAKLKRLEEEEQANAQKRAENEAKYEKKVRAAQERQKKVAQKKAEREEERRAKQSSAPGTQ